MNPFSTRYSLIQLEIRVKGEEEGRTPSKTTIWELGRLPEATKNSVTTKNDNIGIGRLLGVVVGNAIIKNDNIGIGKSLKAISGSYYQKQQYRKVLLQPTISERYYQSR